MKPKTFEEILYELEGYDGLSEGYGKALIDELRFKLKISTNNLPTLLALEREIDQNVKELLKLQEESEKLHYTINKKQELVNSLRKAQIILTGEEDA